MYASDEVPRLMISHLTLRRVVGVFGVLLPVLMVVGAFILGSQTELLTSVSAYYDTVMRDVLVGFEFVIAWFLFAYRGYERKDDIAGDLACFFFLGAALFPTTSPNDLTRIVHGVSAVGLFLMLSYFSLYLFTKTKPGGTPTPEKMDRNKIYVACGVTMLVCMVLIAVYKVFLTDTGISRIKPAFWLEAFAMWAFGVSWITKGEWLRKNFADDVPRWPVATRSDPITWYLPGFALRRLSRFVSCRAGTPIVFSLE